MQKASLASGTEERVALPDLAGERPGIHELHRIATLVATKRYPTLQNPDAGPRMSGE